MQSRATITFVFALTILLSGCDQGRKPSAVSVSDSTSSNGTSVVEDALGKGPAADIVTHDLQAADSATKDSAANATQPLHAKDILGNPAYQAFCYGGYRGKTRDDAPTVGQLKEDLKILAAMRVKVVRTYNTQQYSHAMNLLKAIGELKKENADFEMYVMLGAWIECEGAWTKDVNHEAGNVANNSAEIAAAVRLASQYPDIVKVIAVGNEAMVHWASTYFVRPAVILKWVNELQALKETGGIPSETWISTSDNFAAWGGAGGSYHTEDLTALIKAVDYVSLHTYPFHDTYHTPKFWIAPESDQELTVIQQADAAVARALSHAISQYESTSTFIAGLGIEKPIHIGETGWATTDSSHYGAAGSKAADEYKATLFYDAMREWSNKNRVSCFYFEAFDEQWKDLGDAGGSENHFGLIDLQGRAKFALWDEVDAGMFEGLKRGGVSITKTHGGDESPIKELVLAIPSVNDLGSLAISTTNNRRGIGEEVTEAKYVILHESLVPTEFNDMTHPSELLKLNVWEGTCGMELSGEVLRISTGTGDWWGCALEIQGEGTGENLLQFKSGHLHFEMRGETKSKFQVGMQTGLFSDGTQANCLVTFGPKETYQLNEKWTSHSIPMSELTTGTKARMSDVTGLLSFKSDEGLDGKEIEVRNVFWSRE